MNKQYCIVQHRRNDSVIGQVFGPLPFDIAYKLYKDLRETEETERPMLFYYSLRPLELEAIE